MGQVIENMQMPTLVVPARSDPERDAVVAAWEARGWIVCRVDRFWSPPELVAEDVRLYGDIIFCLSLVEKLGLELISPPDELLLNVDFRWLGRPVKSVYLSEALTQPFPYFAKSAVPKLFRSAVYSSKEELEAETTGLADDTNILASPVVEIIAEARCLILHDKVVSISAYEGRADLGEAKAFAQDFVSSNPGVETYILDIGKMPGHGWAVIEANSVWAGGLNGCDPAVMVDCLVNATRLR